MFVIVVCEWFAALPLNENRVEWGTRRAPGNRANRSRPSLREEQGTRDCSWLESQVTKTTLPGAPTVYLGHPP